MVSTDALSTQPDEHQARKSAYSTAPLPKSQSEHAIINKENCAPDGKDTFLELALSRQEGGFGFSSHKQLKQAQSPQKIFRRTNFSSEKSSLCPTTTSSSARLRSVLRYGETMESLFGLTQESPEEYRKLCRSIVDGPATDDIGTWRRVLEYATSKARFDKQGQDLIRLHRRATSRFPQPAVGQEADLLAIWLSYAVAQMNFSNEKDARLTFRHIQHQKMGQGQADLYVAMAELEYRGNHVEEAIQVIRDGLANRAQPIDQLEVALAKYTEKTAAPWEGRPPASDEVPCDSILSTPSSAKTSLLEDSSSNKSVVGRETTQSFRSTRILSIEGGIELQHAQPTACSPTSSLLKGGFEVATMPENSDTKSTSVHFQLIPPLRSSEGPLTGQDAQTSRTLNTEVSMATETDADKTGIVSSTEKGKSTPRRAAPTGLPLVVGEGSVRFKRRPLLCTISSHSRYGVLGKPARVDPNQSVDMDSGSDNDTHIESNAAHVPKKTKKLSKLDLNYMWEWDPEKPRGSKATGPQTGDSQSTKQSRSPLMEKIDEDPPSYTVNANSIQSNVSGKSQASRGSRVSTSEIHNAATPRNKNRGHQSTEKALTDRKVDLITKASSPRHEEENQEHSGDVSKVNPHFLPLLFEENMIKVNAVPYAKLGVIGKGGSCKVYRALSKECNVVAIKKVKLSGMEKKAIDGYANEIELLKRLRGNPTIIQLFDSEVDLKRKAILLVMELGEVDLNHVLQQQYVSSSKKGAGERRCLNMNFVRLTWQQMLSAVHSIHEARIIHGDLKPANFLFVRGALKLIDFGIAKAIQNDDTTNIYRDNQVGTLNYMSPEAITGTNSSSNGSQMKVGRASDIWSLGCILYQMVYGKTPFADLHMLQKLQAIINPQHLIQFPEILEEDAVDAMRLCLRRNPAERPPIVGTNGLLNAHIFLNRRHQCSQES